MNKQMKFTLWITSCRKLISQPGLFNGSQEGAELRIAGNYSPNIITLFDWRYYTIDCVNNASWSCQDVSSQDLYAIDSCTREPTLPANSNP